MEETTSGTSAVAEAPASTPAPAAPSTPSQSSPVPADRPSSFAEALTAKMTAPAAVNPGVPSPASPEPAAATAQPTQTETPPAETVPAAETAKGPIPFDRHESILKNAREKTTEQVRQQFQQQYGPHVVLGEKLRADLPGTLTSLIEESLSHPQYGPQIVSSLARMLGSRRGQSQAGADSEPQADLQSGDGTQVYSAERLAEIRAYDRQQILKEVDQRLSPLQAREQQRLAVEKQQGEWKAANERMAKTLEPFKQLLGADFAQHKPALLEKSQAFMAEGHDARTALGLAAAHVLRDVVLPARTAQSQQQLVAEAVRKSTGSTSAPGTAAAAPAGRPKDFATAFGRLAM